MQTKPEASQMTASPKEAASQSSNSTMHRTAPLTKATKPTRSTQASDTQTMISAVLQTCSMHTLQAACFFNADSQPKKLTGSTTPTPKAFGCTLIHTQAYSRAAHLCIASQERITQPLARAVNKTTDAQCTHTNRLSVSQTNQSNHSRHNPTTGGG